MNAYEPSTRSPETARASVGGGRKRFEFQKEVDMAQRRAANERECERLAVLAVYRSCGPESGEGHTREPCANGPGRGKAAAASVAGDAWPGANSGRSAVGRVTTTDKDLPHVQHGIMLPASVLDALKNLTTGALKVFIYLCSRSQGQPFAATIPTITDATGIQQRSVIAALKTLEEQKLITRIPGSGNQPNQYGIPF